MEASGAQVDIPAAEELPVTYDESFWKRIPVGVVTPMPANFVLIATKNLCHLLLLQEEVTIVMEKAAKLAAQYRFGVKNSDELLINGDKLRQVFDMRPQVRLDLGTDANEQSRLFVQSDTAEKWQNNFVAFVDSLTVAQSMLFGPLFACLLLKLGKLDVTEVAKEMLYLMDFDEFDDLKWSVELEEENIVTLVSKYAGAMPEKVLFNTVFGGILDDFEKKKSFSPFFSFLFHFWLFHGMTYYGMDLFLLIEELVAMSKRSWSEYRQLTEEHAGSSQKHLAQESWRKYEHFCIQFCPEESKETVPRWVFARIFDDRVFADMSYSQNQWLCNLTIYIIELLKNEPETLIPVDLPFVQSRLRSQIRNLSLADRKLARLIFEKYRPKD